VIGTRRGLAVLALIAGALLVVLVVDLFTRARPADRALVPGFDEASVVRLGWTAHPVGPYLTVERAKGQPWRRTAPSQGAVEQTPIASLLATLRGARWHRSEARDPREDATHLAIDFERKRLELWIGRPIEDSEQAWIGIGERRYLVDAWVARALTPSPLDLSIRTPLSGIANVPEYTVDGVHIEGAPRRIAPHPKPSTVTTSYLTLEPAFVDELERALATLAIDTLPWQPAPHGEAMTIEMAGTRVALGGPCDKRVYLSATTGDGCVPREQADAVRALVEKLHGPPAVIASRAPVPVGIRWVTLVDGKKLDLEKRPTIDGANANPQEVAALMTVLRSPVDAADVVPAPTTEPIGALALVVQQGNGMVLALHPGNLVQRAEEAVALRLAPEAFAILVRGASAYKELTPWREEPTTIDEITIDQTTWKRGAVIGEWTRIPAGPSDAASIEALVRALAEPHVLGVAPTTLVRSQARATGVRGHRIQLVVHPPVGAAKTHTLEVGTAIAGGCPAKIDTTEVLLPVEICRLVPR